MSMSIIVEAVMREMMSQLGRVFWNQNQKPWGSIWDETGEWSPLRWNNICVDVSDRNDDGCSLMTISFDRQSVSTLLGDGREFCRSQYPQGWNSVDFILWAENALAQIIGAGQ